MSQPRGLSGRFSAPTSTPTPTSAWKKKGQGSKKKTVTPPPMPTPLPKPRLPTERTWAKIIYFTPVETNKMNFHVSKERDFIGT